jgi:hypothetical protein
LGKATDDKGNLISPEQQQQATQEWVNHYVNDVTQNGPGARVSRYLDTLGPGIKNAAVAGMSDVGDFLSHPIASTESGVSKAAGAVAGLVQHPISSTAAGLGAGIADVGKGIASLGTGVAEQTLAGAAQNTIGKPNDEQIASAKLAAAAALGRLKGNAAIDNAITPDNPTPGFGIARLAGGLSAGNALAPGPIGKVLGQAGDVGASVAPKLASAAGSVMAAPFRAAGALASHIPGSAILRTAASLAPKAAEEAPVAAADLVKAKAFLEDAPQLRSIALQRVTNAEQAVEDASASGTEAAKTAPLLKEAQDAHQELSKLNMGEALYRHIAGVADEAAQPSTGQKILAGAGRVAGNATAGAVGGVGYQGLAGNPGDPNAAAQGALSGGKLGAIADMYLRSVNGLKSAGDAYSRAQTSVAKSMPSELPEDDNMVFPADKAVQMAKDEVAGSANQSAKKTPVSQPESTGTKPPPFEPAGSVEGLGGKKLPIWNTNEQIGDHPPGSTVVRGTLEKAGYNVPPHPDEKGSPLSAPATPPQVGPTVKATAPADGEAPAVFPSGREVKAVAGATVPVGEAPEGTIPYSPKLPGQHEKINYVKLQMPTEFDPKTHGIPLERQPGNEDLYKLAASTQSAPSTKINGIGYDPQKQLLGVVFNDGKFNVHENVPPELHEALMQQAAQKAAGDKTASVGKLYNAQIRGNPNYKYVSVTTPLHDETGAPLPQIKAASDQIKAHDMRQESLQSALGHGYDTPENIAARAAAELKEHQNKLSGILSGKQGGPTPTPGNALKPSTANQPSAKLTSMRGALRSNAIRQGKLPKPGQSPQSSQEEPPTSP